MAQLGSLADVERILAELGERGYARAMPRRPGQKEIRFEQLLGGAEAHPDDAADTADTAAEPESGPVLGPVPGAGAVGGRPAVSTADGLETRVAALEDQVERLHAELNELRARG
jgi:uncharacterized protein YceH (UPF0502 family)